jgi:ligand-binding sensor domain-containing protein
MKNHYKILISEIILSLSISIYSQFNPPVFENITIANGLPENSVNCILQDYLGYLWFGTQNGLARYDGYSMKVFQPEENNHSSISDRGIVTVYEDKNKTLWVGTLNGLNKLNRSSESFKSYRFNTRDTNSVNGDHILCIYEEKNGRFWVGTTEGLNLFDRDNEVFTRYYFSDGDRKSNGTSHSQKFNLCVNAITEDPVSEDLLIATKRDGLWVFNPANKIFSKYKFNSDKNLDNKIGWIQSFCKSRDGKIWMASNNTLSSLDPKKKTFKSYIEYPIKINERYINWFHYGSVIEDKDGLIWSGYSIGERGVYCLNPSTGSILQYNLSPEKQKTAGYNQVFTLFEDRQGIIWIGTWISGVMKLDKRKNKFQLLSSDPNNFSNSLSHSSVYSVTFDPKGFIWYCTRRALDKYDIKTGIYNHYLKNEGCITKSIYAAIQDKSGYVWLSTANCGLIRFDPSTESYRFYFNDANEPLNLVNKQMTSILLDRYGFLWIGTSGFGLYKCDIVNNKLTNYKNDPNDLSSLTHDFVNRF